MVKQTANKNSMHLSLCDISGATLQSCNVAGVIQDVRDQPESIRARSAVVNLLCPVEFIAIPQPRILDAWQQWPNVGCVWVTQDLAIFGCLPVWPCSYWNFDLGPSPSNSTKKINQIRAYDFGVQFSSKRLYNKETKRDRSWKTLAVTMADEIDGRTTCKEGPTTG